MRKFLYKILWFIIILILPLTIGVFLPATPRALKSLIFSDLQKDSLIKNVESPRIIFIGGSNLSFGLNCQMIKDSLNINPVNTGIHASIGLIYMMSNSLKFIKEGDIVILVPEYQQFCGDYAYGDDGEELTRTIFDVNISKIHLLNIEQIINVIKKLPKYSISKFKASEYYGIIESDIYGVNSFNKYGDAYKHWGLKRVVFKPFGNIGNNLNQEVFNAIKEYQIEIEKKNAVLLISYPGYQDLSYLNSNDYIKKIETQLKINGFTTIGSPEEYMIPDSLMFNTPYHLSKKGVDYRTNLLISDIKKILIKVHDGNN
jgi:hypothetical protein